MDNKHKISWDLSEKKKKKTEKEKNKWSESGGY